MLDFDYVIAAGLADDAHSCVHCGWCCRQRTCGWADWDEAKHQCSALEERDGLFYCGKYADILGKPTSEVCPAFGAGCCTNLNSDRQRILRQRGDSLYTGQLGEAR